MTATLRDLTLFDDLEPETEAPADVPLEDEDWKISVRLTLREIQSVARGELPETLVAYCREGLQHWAGSPALAACEAHAVAKEATP